ncbi:MAG TPA: hypothetical protein PKO33_12235, partial [Pyrinomonadaceae bacterium]|nr:hypothetical protein [Pyrinomonadaceae bacterium]
MNTIKVVLAAALLLAGAAAALAQSSETTSDAPKVTFDDKTTGVAIIEINGVRYVVDSNKKTVEKLG